METQKQYNQTTTITKKKKSDGKERESELEQCVARGVQEDEQGAGLPEPTNVTQDALCFTTEQFIPGATRAGVTETNQFLP